MKKIILLLFLPCILFAQQIKGPDKDTVKKISIGLDQWYLDNSGLCAYSEKDGLWAWKLLYARNLPRNPNIRTGKDRKSYIAVILVPDRGEKSGMHYLETFNWKLPDEPVEQFHCYLGKGRGYFWFVKADVATLLFLRKHLALKNGEDFDFLMARALNVSDEEKYTSRVAIEYFRGRGDKAVPLILQSMDVFLKMEPDEQPVPHLIALHLTWSKLAGKTLMQYARSTDHKVARIAISLLLAPPYTGTDSFYRQLLRNPEFTAGVLQMYRDQKRLKELEPYLKQMLKSPRSIRQYGECAATLYQIRSNRKEIPELEDAFAVLFLSMRMGDTPETIKYISLDKNPGKMDDVERKRIQPYLDKIIKSEDKELVFVAALGLATFNPKEKDLSKEYIARIRKDGLEILRSLPPAFVYARLQFLTNSVQIPEEKSVLKKLQNEFGRRT